MHHRELLTSVFGSHILEDVSDLRKRIAALAGVAAIVAGLWVPCAGWQATAESRLTCCMADGSCPMDESGLPGATSQNRVTQSAADTCCAAAERSRSTSPRSSSSLDSLLPLAIIDGPLSDLPADVASTSSSSHFDDVAPLPHAPRHLLLSVFLV